MRFNFNSLIRCMVGVINIAFGGLDYAETSSYPRFKLRLCKNLVSGMKSRFCIIDIHCSCSKF